MSVEVCIELCLRDTESSGLTLLRSVLLGTFD